MYHTRIIRKQLHFKQPAGTSRGVYTTRDAWYVVVTDDRQPGSFGVGECAPLPDLSCDAGPRYEAMLQRACRMLERDVPLTDPFFDYHPSVRFGLETALAHLRARTVCLGDTAFGRGGASIPINGLIWMGTSDEMRRRIDEKLAQGFRCIKLKIGAIRFEEELELLAYIRRRVTPEQVELRVDANGAFTPDDAPEKLQRLAAFHLHSIEQPIRAGQWKEMARLCADTPLPIALDEELIGINSPGEKALLLDTLRPHYIVLKPSLHGGLSGAEQWIALARERGIGWWVTSALESNVGLNALAHWCAGLHPSMPQGLGTGLLFTDNIDYPLLLRGDRLSFRPGEPEPELLNWLGV